MSKSKGNVVSPEEIINNYGADTARLFILFAAPPERDLEWSDQGVEGSFRFLNRVWRLVTGSAEDIAEVTLPERFDELDADAKKLRFKTHASIKKVTEDLTGRFSFNTAISAIMELSNTMNAYRELEEQDLCVLKEAVNAILLLLSPFAPHITEELWHLIGHEDSIYLAPWPTYDLNALVQDEVEIVLQISGKVRDRIVVPTGSTYEQLEAIALSNDKIKEFTAGKEMLKIIVVPGKLVNIVVK